jgi:hypothetical protein
MQNQNLEPNLENDDSNWPKWFIPIIVIAFIISITVVGLYFFKFHYELKYPLSSNQDVWGTFGDYVGGVLNPFFSFLAFVALLFTIVLQNHQLGFSKQELEASRKELELTRREAMLTRIATIVLNQVATFRKETTFLKFKQHGSLEEEDLLQMLYSMSVVLDKLKETEELRSRSENHQCLYNEKRSSCLGSITLNLSSFMALVEGLTRCCKSNIYLLTNQALKLEDAKDIKSLLFSELPTSLMSFLSKLALFIKGIIEQDNISKDVKTRLMRIYQNCEFILGYFGREITPEILQSYRNDKDTFV